MVRRIEAVGTASAQRAVDARKAAAVQVAADEPVTSVRDDCSEQACAYGMDMKEAMLRAGMKESTAKRLTGHYGWD